jgi:hypothetical protein
MHKIILKAKTKYEKFYNLLSDVEDESNITPSDEKLSEPINIIKSSSDIEINCTKRACTVNGLSFSVLDWWVGNSTISASNVDYCC